jgi:hypothetical protein
MIFLIVGLVRSEYLVVPQVHSPLLLVLSFLSLFAGFWLIAVYWKYLLHGGGVETSHARAVASIGLSIFAKYIPGKVWVILGRATYIAEKEKVGKGLTSTLSFQAQLITLWAGLLLGGIGIMGTGHMDQIPYALTLLLFWLAFTLIIFTPYFNQVIQKAIRMTIRKEVTIPIISMRKMSRIMPYFFLNWFAWCAGFWLLGQSLVDFPLNPDAGLGFAVAGTMGILAIIVPGGIGVREGFLTWYLMLMGLDKQSAITISVASRLWFLFGEVFIFLLGVYYHRKDKAPMTSGGS